MMGKTEKEAEQQESYGPEPWLDDLKTRLVNDNTWECYVGLLVEAESELAPITHVLNQANPRRWSFQIIPFSSLVAKIKTNSKKSAETTPLGLLCQKIREVSGKYLENPIPTSMLASLIKYEILRFKEEDKSRVVEKEAIIKSLTDRYRKYNPKDFEETQEKTVEVKVKKEVKPVKQTKDGKKTPKIEEKEQEKKYIKLLTKLKRRGQERRNIRYVEDSNEMGPKMYFMLTNIYDPDLPLELVKNDIPLKLILQLHLPRDNFSLETIKKIEKQTKLKRLTKSFLRWDDQNEESKTDIIVGFWSNMLPQLWHPDNYNFLKHVLQAHFVPKLPIINDFNKDKGISQFQDELYDGVTYSMYDVYKIHCLYEKYMQEVKILKIPTISDLPKPDLYDKILNSVSCKGGVSVPIILDAIVAQVCRYLQEDPGFDISLYGLSSSSEEIKTHKIAQETLNEKQLHDAKITLSVFQKLEAYELSEELCSKEAEKKNLSKDDYEVIEEGDELGKTLHKSACVRELLRDRTSHILNLFLESQEWMRISKVCENVLAKSPWKKEWESFIKHIGILKESEFCISQAIITWVNSKSFSNSMDVLAMWRKITDYSEGNVSMETASKEIFINDIKAIQNGIKQIRNHSHITSNFEEMTSDILRQQFMKAISDYNTMQATYSPLLGANIITFKNSSKSMNWNATMSSAMHLRDFFETVMFEESMWTEKSLRDMNKKSMVQDLGNEESKLSKKIYDLGKTQRFYVQGRLRSFQTGPGSSLTSSFHQNMYSFPFLSIEVQEGDFSFSYQTSNPANQGDIKVFMRHVDGTMFTLRKSLTKEADKKYMPEEIVPFEEEEKEDEEQFENKTKTNLGSSSRGFSLFGSLPCGLCFEAPPLQQLAIPDCSESYRIFLPEGKVFCFMKNSTVRELSLNGTIRTYPLIPREKGEAKSKQNIKTTFCTGSPFNSVTSLKLDDAINIELKDMIEITPDGRVFKFEKNNTFSLQSTIFSLDKIQIFEDSINTERMDGTIFLHKGDGSLTVQQPDGTQIYSVASFSDEKVEISDENLLNEDFVVIEITEWCVEGGPGGYQRVSYHKEYGLALHILSDMMIHIQCKGVSKVQLESKLDFNISNEKAVIRKFDDSRRIIRESELIFQVCGTDPKIESSPVICTCMDRFGRVAAVDLGGEIHSPSGLWQRNVMPENNRVFLIRPGIEASGAEFKIDKTKDLKLDEVIHSHPVSNHFYTKCLTLRPFNPDHSSSKLPRIQFKPLYEKPSTYGDTWPFPFKIRSDELEHGTTLIIKFFLKFQTIENTLNKFKELLEYFLSDHLVQLRDKSTLYGEELVDEDKEEEIDILEILRRSCNYSLADKLYSDHSCCHDGDGIPKKLKHRSVISRIAADRAAILCHNIPPYFESAKGASFLIMEEVMEVLKRKIEELRGEYWVQKVLSKPLTSITDKEAKQLMEYFGKDPLSHLMKGAVNTNSELFPNIKSILEMQFIAKMGEGAPY